MLWAGTDEKTVFILTDQSALYRSTDEGKTWVETWSGQPARLKQSDSSELTYYTERHAVCPGVLPMCVGCPCVWGGCAARPLPSRQSQVDPLLALGVSCGVCKLNMSPMPQWGRVPPAQGLGLALEASVGRTSASRAKSGAGTTHRVVFRAPGAKLCCEKSARGPWLGRAAQ